jgi:chromosome segregation ATPase
MNDRKSSHFKFGEDEESPDKLFEAEITEQRVDKLSQRLTLISVLIPCLVGILLFLAYMDMNKRFITVEGTGEKEFKNLSENMESSYSSLSVQFAKLDEAMKTKVSAIEKAVGTMKNDLGRTDSTLAKTVKSIQAEKAGKKDLAGAVSKINKKFVPIHEDLKKIVSYINQLEERIKQNIENLAGSVEKVNSDIENLENEMSTLSSAKIDQKAFELALKVEQKSYLQKLNQTSKDLEDQIASTQNRINDLERLLKRLEAVPKTKPLAPAPPQEQAEQAETPEKQAEKPSPLPPPGKIIEQDIQ